LNPPVLFLHIGWARRYRGDADDLPQGKFGYIQKREGTPAETRNFRPRRGRLHGYAAQATVDLGRLETDRGADHRDGVLVIWTAKNPVGSGRYVVGWYRNARVHAARKEPGHLPFPVLAEAPESDCHLVEVDDRSFFIPSRQKGWPGTSSAFYASDLLSDGQLSRIFAYVDGSPSDGFVDVAGASPAIGNRAVATAEDRKEVEEAALKVVEAHYGASGWDVADHCDLKLGWDMTVSRGRRRLFVEVKGRRGRGPVTLTPKELRTSQAPECRMRYRIAIVFDATSATPELHIFSYVPGTGVWESPAGSVLTFKDILAAELTF
jgi:hypothetical protein